MFKREFLKKLGLLSGGAAAGVASSSALTAAGEANPLVGLWEMTVVSKTATYRYLYSISDGAYVATGSIDEGFQGFKYGPTMGSYTMQPDGSYRYIEKGWVFDMRGANVGAFRSAGTFKLGAGQRSFSGPGTFTQFDVNGKVVFEEPFVARATKASQ